jgi:phage tail sheath gpL-like
MISFVQIPLNLRTPGVYAEIDNSRAVAGLTAVQKRAILVGQMLSTGSATANIPIRTNVGNCDAQFGVGSMLANMVRSFAENNEFTELWGLPVADVGAGAQASGSVTFTGTATEAGTAFMLVDGRSYQVGITKDDVAADVAQVLVDLITADGTAGVTAVRVGDAVTITARHKGTLGNKIDLRINYGDNQALPAGITVAIVAMSGGATDPDITTALGNLGETQFHYVGNPFSDATNLTALEDELEDRNNPLVQLEGLAFTAASDTHGNLTTLGNSRNSQFNSIMGIYKSPSNPWVWAAAYTAIASFYLTNDPARPLQTLVLEGILPPARTDRFTLAERNNLLYDGIATAKVTNDDKVQIERSITTYQTNPTGVPDISYLDVETMATLFFIREQLRIRIALRYPRYKLAGNEAIVRPGSALVRPKDIRNEIIALLAELAAAGIVENINASQLVVERNDTDPNRVDALIPPDIVNQFRVFAGQIQFVL